MRARARERGRERDRERGKREREILCIVCESLKESVCQREGEKEREGRARENTREKREQERTREGEREQAMHTVTTATARTCDTLTFAAKSTSSTRSPRLERPRPRYDCIPNSQLPGAIRVQRDRRVTVRPWPRSGCYGDALRCAHHRSGPQSAQVQCDTALACARNKANHYGQRSVHWLTWRAIPAIMLIQFSRRVIWGAGYVQL